MSLGGRIRIGMAMRGISTPAALARKMKLPRQTIQKWIEGSVTRLEPENLFALADALGVSARWLGIKDGPPQKPLVLDLEQNKVLEVYEALNDEALRDAWLQSGAALIGKTQPASAAHPFRRKDKV